MSLFPDITPLVNQIKEFTLQQAQTNQLLMEILQELKLKK
jgi:hypothetical protein